MKKVNSMKWLSFFLMAILSVGFMACSDDDDDEEFSLIGMWEYSYNGGYDLYLFNGDGTGKGATSEGVFWTFKYELNAKTMKLVYTKENESAEVWSIEPISNSSIEIDGEWILSKTEKQIEEIEEKPQYEAVDLGLSVKWATCNVGASSPEEFGDYFAWGETEPKSRYRGFTYKWGDDYMTKYCTESEYGTVDNLVTLLPSDDAATVNWGNDWRMPTFDEIKELFSEKCIIEWTEMNNVKGVKIIGPNGNRIFLPAASILWDNEIYDVSEGSCCYWSSSLCTTFEFCFCDEAHCIWIEEDYYTYYATDRFRGLPIRPVTK
ncbi:MAG: hypothetical protein IJ417_04695 [Bacteroidaceae bacterium]|nr:hypothetical protein [Bacteroidaceae bacterium]